MYPSNCKSPSLYTRTKLVCDIKISFSASVNSCPEVGGAKAELIWKKSTETVFTSGEMDAPVNENDALQAVKTKEMKKTINPIFLTLITVQYHIL